MRQRLGSLNLLRLHSTYHRKKSESKDYIVFKLKHELKERIALEKKVTERRETS